MAFSTELVLKAQTGPSVDYKEVPTSSRSASGSYGIVGSLSVGEGTWLVAWTAPLSKYNAGYYGADIDLAGSVILIKGSSALNSASTMGHSTVVTGPRQVTIQTKGADVAAGSLRAARIG